MESVSRTAQNLTRDQRFQDGIFMTTSDGIDQVYKNWADHYDKDHKDTDFGGPRFVAEALEKYFPGMSLSEPDMEILDVAGGTGLVAQELIKCGYKNIDCVDASKDMLQVARSKGVYRQMFEAFVGPEPTPGISNGKYDLLVTCAAFLGGHLNQSVFPEFLRVVKPGGKILILMGEIHLTRVEIYRGKFEPAMDELVKQGKWIKVARDVIPNYNPKVSPNGALFIFQKL